MTIPDLGERMLGLGTLMEGLGEGVGYYFVITGKQLTLREFIFHLIF